jgi:hypothetical protein
MEPDADVIPWPRVPASRFLFLRRGCLMMDDGR